MTHVPETLLTPEALNEERQADLSLRPQRLSDFVGQAALRDRLGLFIEAARQRGEHLDHVLLSGPPGLGKTTLSHIIAHELQVGITVTSGPAIERAGDLAAILTNLKERDVLFIDEIHRLNRTVEEILYPAMEDFKLDIVIGQGPSARTVRLDLPRFTLVGATTRAGLLGAPLRDRFGVQARMDYYPADEMDEIVQRAAKKMGVGISSDGAMEIARRSRGTPRIAGRLLRRVRDFAQVRANGNIDASIAHQALQMLDVDEQGLDHMDRRILRLIIEQFRGGPVGVETLSAALSEETDTIEDVYEPYLIQRGFLQRTPRGRIATAHSYTYLGLTPPAAVVTPDLFDTDA